ncbi:MAG: hypothetical protein KJ955_01235 [Nanoarchaeota archaeon]|nr:hypothetical protein [Nanoarchaeota archaeon]
MRKRFYRPKDELKKLLVIKIAVCIVMLIIFFSLLVAYYASHLTDKANCLRGPARDAVLTVCANGGYLSPASFVGYHSYSVPFYKDKDVENVPSMEDVKKGILQYLKENAPECGDDIEVRIKGDDVKVGSAFSHTTIDVDMKEIYDEAVKLYTKQKDTSVISLAELARMAKEGDYIMQINANNDTILYLLSFTEEEIGGIPVVYSFGIRR